MNRQWLLVFLACTCVGSAAAGPWQGFTALAVSSDGRSFATGGREGEVLWGDSNTGEILGRWSSGTGKPIIAVAFDPTGRRLGAVGLDGRFFEGDLGAGTWISPVLIPSGWTVLSAAVARWTRLYPLAQGVQADSVDRVAIGNPDGTIVVSRKSDGRPLVSWVGHEAAVTGVAWVGDGRYLLSCSYDGGLGLWDASTGKGLGRL